MASIEPLLTSEWCARLSLERLPSVAISAGLITLLTIGLGFFWRAQISLARARKAAALVLWLLMITLLGLLGAGWERSTRFEPVDVHCLQMASDCQSLSLTDADLPETGGRERMVTKELRGAPLNYRCSTSRCVVDSEPPGFAFQITPRQAIHACGDMKAGLMVVKTDELIQAALVRTDKGWVPRHYARALHTEASSAPREWLHTGLASLAVAGIFGAMAWLWRRNRWRSMEATGADRDPEVLREKHFAALHNHLVVISILGWGLAPLVAAALTGILL